jgi:beta-glucosidase
VGAQAPLVRAIANTNTPAVVVFSSGKPISEPWISNSTAALVQQFYPSEQGGNALADVLFGAHNPSGKLSVSFPRSVGTAPSYYDYLHSGRSIGDSGQILPNGTLVFGHQYVLDSALPWYEFGYGKSYSTFKYGKLSLSKLNATSKDTIMATVPVTNTSPLDGTEVVQLYVEDMISSVVVPNRMLKGFKKVAIKAKETTKVSISIDVSQLGLWNMQMKYVVEPGEFVVRVGSSSLDIRANATLWVS